MAALSLRGPGSADAVAALLSKEIPNSGVSCEQVAFLRRTVGNTAVFLLVFEKYYMRSSNRASLSVLVSGGSGGIVTVDAVGAGGGQGALFRFSWGAEESFIEEVERFLRPQGFSPA